MYAMYGGHTWARSFGRTASVFNITSKNSGCFMESYIVVIIKKSGHISNFVADIMYIHLSIDTI